MISVKVLTFDDLLNCGWSLYELSNEAARVEFSQFEDGAYTENQFAEWYTSHGGLCALLFPENSIKIGSAVGVAAGRERRAIDGAIAHQLITIAIEPNLTGQGFGPQLDRHYEAHVLECGYHQRILRSRAPSHIFATFSNQEGGSPKGVATRFAIKRGFCPMNKDQTLNFFNDDISKLIESDVLLGDTVLSNCIIAESHPQGSRPPWYFICMNKSMKHME